MADRDWHSADGGGSSGFLRPLKLLLAGLSSALHTRVELFVAELEEERERLKQSLILILLAVLGISLGAILLTIFVIALLWERGWIAAIGMLALIYLGVGGWAAASLRNKLLARPGLFPDTLAELAKDRDRLKASARE
ncbi:MAG: phage holin family protein [Deltaproteobacteria bacterium]|nr:phage holin family protein [Deltaproteobacteria bacterium]